MWKYADEIAVGDLVVNEGPPRRVVSTRRAGWDGSDYRIEYDDGGFDWYDEYVQLQVAEPLTIPVHTVERG